MEALRDILSPHSIVLYMATKDGFLEIEEVVSESDLYIDRGQKIRPRTGYIGWVAKTKTSLLIEDVKNRKENLIYYKGEVPVKSFLAVPLITEIGDTESRVYNFSFSKELFGILCLDSLCEDAFGNREKQILSIVVEQIIEIFKRYKLLVKVQLEAREFSWLYEFTKKLSYTLELNDITECIVSSICKVVNADLVALLLLDKERNVSVLSRVGRERRKEVEGKGVPITNTLTGWVIEYGRYLYCENLSEREKHKSVFGRKLDFALGIGYIKPILIYPLLVPKTDGTGNEPSTLGCIVIGRKEGKSFTEREKNLVEIMVREASISLSNSIMYQRTKELAITDGLTNLYNHRHFQERLSDSLAWADRFYGRVSLILTDVDSFKALNDTYGHQVGDSVLRTLARIFKNSVRRIDVVARYGGDEFAIILVNTDQRGAKVAVDKLRDLVEKTHFGVEGRELFVTVSLGVATYPDDASTRELLIERADQALYHAKRIGRNKGLHYEDIIKKEARG